MLSTLRKKAKGFTLIELLIVVAIIGILAAIAIPNLLQAQRRSRISRAQTDTKQVVTQATLYINDTNCMPTSAAAGCTTLTMPNALMNGNANNTRYMAATYDPFGTTATTQYRYSENPLVLTGEIRAWSLGPNIADDSFASDDVGYSSYSGQR